MNAPPSAEIIAVGDELTSGARLDTNSQWLAQQLLNLGIHVGWHTCVGDQLADVISTLRVASSRADFVITSGGLGPTADDLTRQALADFAGKLLELDANSLAHIEQIFASRNRPMPDRNRIQAMFPQGATVIPNPHGTAPGICLDVPVDQEDNVANKVASRSVRYFSLPGVPAELKEMWTWVAGSLQALLPESGVTLHHELHCFGAGESDVEAMLPDLIRRGRDPSVGITASEATITLRVTATRHDAIECRAAMEPTVAIIRDALGELLYGEEGAQLQDVLLERLAARGETLATLEIGSAGRLAGWLSDAETARHQTAAVRPAVFRGGRLLSPAAWQEMRTANPAASLVNLACLELRASGVDWILGIGPFPPIATNRDKAGDFAVVIASASDLTGLNAAAQQLGADQEFQLGPDCVNYLLREYPFASHPAIAHSRATKIALNAFRKLLK